MKLHLPCSLRAALLRCLSRFARLARPLAHATALPLLVSMGLLNLSAANTYTWNGTNAAGLTWDTTSENWLLDTSSTTYLNGNDSLFSGMLSESIAITASTTTGLMTVTSNANFTDSSNLTITDTLSISNNAAAAFDEKIVTKDIALDNGTLSTAGAIEASGDASLAGTSAMTADTIAVTGTLSTAEDAVGNLDATNTTADAIILGKDSELTSTGSLKATNDTTVGEGSSLSAKALETGALTLEDGSTTNLASITATDAITMNGASSLKTSGAISTDGDFELGEGAELDAESLESKNLTLKTGAEATLDTTVIANADITMGDKTSLSAGTSVTATGDLIIETGAEASITSPEVKADDVTLGASASLDLKGNLTAKGDTTLEASASLDVEGKLASTNITVKDGASLTGTDTITASNDIDLSGESSLSATTSITATGDLKVAAGADSTITSPETVADNVTLGGAASLDVKGNLTAKGDTTLEASASLDVDGKLASTNITVKDGAAVTATDSITASQDINFSGTSSMEATNTIAATGDIIGDEEANVTIKAGDSTSADNVILTGDTTMSVEGALITQGNVELNTNGDFTLKGESDKGTASVVGGSITGTDSTLLITDKADLTVKDVINMSGEATITDGAQVVVEKDVTIVGTLHVLGVDTTADFKTDATVTDLEMGGTASLTVADTLKVLNDITTEAGAASVSNITATEIIVDDIKLGDESTLTVSGETQASGNLELNNGGTLTLTDTATESNSNIQGTVTGDDATFNITGTAQVDIEGEIDLDGTSSLNIEDSASLTAKDRVYVEGSVTLNDEGEARFYETIEITGSLNVNDSAELIAEKRAEIDGNVNVAGTGAEATFADTLDVTGNVSVSAGGSLSAEAKANIDGTLSVSGADSSASFDTSLDAGSMTLSDGGKATVEGSTELTGDLSIDNATANLKDDFDAVNASVSNGGTLNVKESTTLSGDLTVNAATADLDGSLSATNVNLSNGASLLVEESTTVNGKLDLDYATADLEGSLSAMEVEVSSNATLNVEGSTKVGSLSIEDNSIVDLEGSLSAGIYSTEETGIDSVSIKGNSQLTVDGEATLAGINTENSTADFNSSLKVVGDLASFTGSKLEVSKEAIFEAGLTLDSTDADLKGSLDVTGATNISNATDLDLTGAANLQGTLSVTESSTNFQDSLTVTDGLASFTDSDLDVAQAATFEAGLTVDKGEADFQDTLTVTGTQATLTNGADVEVQGEASFEAGLSVESASELVLNGVVEVSGGAANIDAATVTALAGAKLESLSMDGGTLEVSGILPLDKTSISEGEIDKSLLVTGDAVLDNGSTLIVLENADFDGNLDINDSVATFKGQDILTVAGTLTTTNGTELTVIADADIEGDMNLADTTADFKQSVDVAQNTEITAGSTVTIAEDATLHGTLTASDSNITVGDDMTVAGLVSLSGGELTVEDDAVLEDGLTMTNDAVASIEDTLIVTGATDLSSGAILSVVDTTTLNGTLTMDAATLQVTGTENTSDLVIDDDVVLTGGSTLAVADDLTINGDTKATESTITVGDNAGLNGELTATKSTITISGDLDVEEATSLSGGELAVKGDATLHSGLSMEAGAIATVENALAVTGDTTLNSASNLTANGTAVLTGKLNVLDSQANFNGETLDVTDDVLVDGGALSSNAVSTLNGDLTVQDSGAATFNNELSLTEGDVLVQNDSTLTHTAGDATINGDLTVAGDSEATFSGDTMTAINASVTTGLLSIGDGTGSTVASVSTLSLVDAGLNVLANSTMTTSLLTGDAESNLSGHLIIDGTSETASVYSGTYHEDATVELLSNAEATLTLSTAAGNNGAGLNALGQEGSIFNLVGASGAGISSLISSGTVNLGLMEESLYLDNASAMTGGELNVSFTLEAIEASLQGDDPEDVGTANYLTNGATFDMTGTTVNVGLVTDEDPVYIDVAGKANTDQAIITISDNEASVLEGLDVQLEGFAYNKYFTNIRTEGQSIVVDLNTTVYNDLGVTKEGSTGLAMISKTMIEVNPQLEREEYTDLAAIMDAMDSFLDSTDASASANAVADRFAAAVAGVSVTSLNSSLLYDVSRQVNSMRNRNGQRMSNTGDSKMEAQYWVAVEGGSSHLDNSGYAAGHSYNSIGGSVGADCQVMPDLTVGAAFTSMYGDIDNGLVDCGNGELNTLYLSAYARYTRDKWTHNAAFTVGASDASLSRRVYIPGSDYYSTYGDTNGTAIALSYEVAYDMGLKVGESVKLQPIANISLISSSIDAYSESGSDAALHFGKQDNAYVSFGLGIQGQAEVGTALFNKQANLGFRGVLKLDAGDRSSDVDVSFINNRSDTYRLNGNEASAAALELGAGLTIPVEQYNGSIFADVSCEFRGDCTSISSSAGYRFTF